MICKVSSADLFGASVFDVCVEADVAGGLPGFYMVGLPSNEVREAKERVIRAIVNSGFSFPARKVTINLSPAYIPKHGSGLDLPIAVSILAAMGELDPASLKGKLFIGELSLDGSVNKVRGALPITAHAAGADYSAIVLPEGNAFEGAAVEGIRVHKTSSLKEIVSDLNCGREKDVDHVDIEAMLDNACTETGIDFADIYGQESAKKATLTAVSGFHNILYIGPPGAGKSMMARRIPTIFSRMTRSECIEVSMIYSIAGMLEDEKLILERPFRAPDQGITEAALIGGTSSLKPGEITLAHRGVLFLDEFSQFKRNTIDMLRSPLENGSIVINRVSGSTEFPCSFMLAAATNPCPCGHYPDRRFCSCTESEVSRFLSRIKGPVLDRIDICVGMSKVNAEDLRSAANGMTSKDMREMADKAINIQKKRFAGSSVIFNSQMNRHMIKEFCVLDKDTLSVLNKAYERFNMSARGWYKVIKVARTLADLEERERIDKKDVLEALGYRNDLLDH